MSFVRKTVFVSASQLFVICLTTLAGILFARALGPAGIGRYDLLRSTAQVGGVLLALGIGNAAVYFLNHHRISTTHLASTAFKTGVLLAATLFVVLAVGMAAFPRYFGSAPTWVVLLFAGGAGCQLITDLLYPVLVAQLAARRMVSVQLTKSSVLLLVGGALVLLHKLSVNGALLVLALSFFVTSMLVVMYLSPEIDLRTPFDWRLAGRLTRYGLTLSASNLLYLLALNVALFLLRKLEPDQFDQLGLYSRATALCGLIILFPQTIAPLLYSKWSQTPNQVKARQVELVARLSTSLGLAAAIVVALCGKYILWLLYGHAFAAAAGTLRILVVAVVCMAMFNVFVQLLASDGRARATNWILATSVVVTSLLTILLVPHFGIEGAALAVLCGNAIAALLAMRLSAKLYGIRPSRCVLLQPQDIALGWTALASRGPKTVNAA